MTVKTRTLDTKKIDDLISHLIDNVAVYANNKELLELEVCFAMCQALTLFLGFAGRKDPKQLREIWKKMKGLVDHSLDCMFEESKLFSSVPGEIPEELKKAILRDLNSTD